MCPGEVCPRQLAAQEPWRAGATTYACDHSLLLSSIAASHLACCRATGSGVRESKHRRTNRHRQEQVTGKSCWRRWFWVRNNTASCNVIQNGEATNVGWKCMVSLRTGSIREGGCTPACPGRHYKMESKRHIGTERQASTAVSGLEVCGTVAL